MRIFTPPLSFVVSVLVKHDSSVNKSCAANVVSSADCCRIHGENTLLQVRCVALALAQADCDRHTTAVLIKYGVQEHGDICTRCKTSATNGRLSFNGLEAPSVLPSADYVQNVDGHPPLASSEIFPSVRVGGEQKVMYDDLALPEYGIFPCIF
jgi:hypothetical protein